MTLGILVPLIMLLIAAVETVVVMRLIGRVEASDPTAPPIQGAPQKALALKAIIAAAWLMPAIMYIILNVATDIGATKIF